MVIKKLSFSRQNSISDLKHSHNRVPLATSSHNEGHLRVLFLYNRHPDDRAAVFDYTIIISTPLNNPRSIWCIYDQTLIEQFIFPNEVVALDRLSRPVTLKLMPTSRIFLSYF